MVSRTRTRREPRRRPQPAPGRVIYSEQMVHPAGPVIGECGVEPGPIEGRRSFDSGRGDEASAVEPVEDGPSVLPLAVRSIGLGDVSDLRRLTAFYRLDQPDSSVAPSSRFGAGVRSSLPLLRAARPTFVARAGQRLVGFAQFRTVAPDHRWRLLALGASVGVFDADPVWEALLTHAVRDAGLRGVKRLYARLPIGVPVAPALHRGGWSNYAAETVFAGSPIGARLGSLAVRLQSPADTWAIHQLYSAAVPRPVQNAEAYTSHRWDLGATERGRSGSRVGGWLIDEGHEVIGYARTTTGRKAHVLDVVVLPGRSDVLDDLLAGALAGLPTSPARRVLCAVRSYQAEVATALEGRGFVSVLDQDLMVKYTTASVRVPAVEAVPFHVEVRDSLPQRVPSFLHGRPRDGSAN